MSNSFKWSKWCLYANVFGVIVFAAIGVNLVIQILLEFRSLPEYNVWSPENCTVVNELVHLPSFYNISVARTGQHDLCALAQNKSELPINITNNQSFYQICYLPPLPIVIEVCNDKVPLDHLVLLEDQEERVAKLLLRHEWYYWSSWASGVLTLACCWWGCYSYWFRWFLCPEVNYWRCCRGDRVSAFQQEFVADHFDENFEVNFTN